MSWHDPPMPDLDRWYGWTYPPYDIEWEAWTYYISSRLDFAAEAMMYQVCARMEVLRWNFYQRPLETAFEELYDIIYGINDAFTYLRHAVWYQNPIDRWLRGHQEGRMTDAEIFDAVVREVRRRW